MSIPEKILQAGCDAYAATFLNGNGSLGDGIEAAYLAIHGHDDWVRAGPPAWTGEGLPPVGAVCKFQRRGDTYCFKEDLFDGHVVTIIAHYQGVTGHTVAAFTFDDEDGNTRDVESATEHHFSPSLTPEQIAAEEREKAIDEMAQDLGKFFSNPKVSARTIYDAGYRKQVAP